MFGGSNFTWGIIHDIKLNDIISGQNIQQHMTLKRDYYVHVKKYIAISLKWDCVSCSQLYHIVVFHFNHVGMVRLHIFNFFSKSTKT